MNNSCKYFFDRVLELLHKKTFDSYRVSLHNPYTIFDELSISLEKFNKKRIKRFDPTITSIIEEALSILNNKDLEKVFNFGSFTQKQIENHLKEKDSKEGKKNRTLSLISNTLIYENKDFRKKLLNEIRVLLKTDNEADFLLLDLFTGWWITQLTFQGYSRKYILDKFRSNFKQFEKNKTIDEVIDGILDSFEKGNDKYDVIFKIKCNLEQELRSASNQLNFILDFPSEFKGKKFINEKFQEKSSDEQYIKIQIESLDFQSSLKKALQIISETIDLNALHDSYNKIIIEKQALVIHAKSKLYRFLPIEDSLDGFYNYQESEFHRFIDNFKKMKNDSVVREKINSAIRFYKIGNESVEVEHKILNYWIGFEQLFSAVDSDEDAIKRIKSYFIAMNCVYYWQRKTNYLISTISRAGLELKVVDLLPTNTTACDTLSPFVKTRYINLLKTLNHSQELKSFLIQHIKRLEQHLTRIYRVRNEIVHEGRSKIDLFLIAGHLRHYLIFSIEQITNEFIENPTLEQIDDVFVYFETLLERIKSAENIQEIFSIKEFRGFME